MEAVFASAKKAFDGIAGIAGCMDKRAGAKKPPQGELPGEMPAVTPAKTVDQEWPPASAPAGDLEVESEEDRLIKDLMTAMQSQQELQAQEEEQRRLEKELAEAKAKQEQQKRMLERARASKQGTVETLAGGAVRVVWPDGFKPAAGEQCDQPFSMRHNESAAAAAVAAVQPAAAAAVAVKPAAALAVAAVQPAAAAAVAVKPAAPNDPVATAIKKALKVRTPGSERGAEACIEALVANGVSTIFANPGTTEMVLVEAIAANSDNAGDLTSVLVCEEKVATGAADGYARVSGRPVATLLHLGPGLANSLSNLHNARRAGTPILNLVGEMSTWMGTDPPLAMDIRSLGLTVGSVVTNATAQDVYGDTARCVRAVTASAAPGASRVATLVLPHDCTRMPADLAAARTADAATPPPEVEAEASGADIARAASLLKEHGSKACIFAGGLLLVRASDGGELENLGALGESTKATLMCKNSFARIDRGAAAPRVTRCPYFPDAAKKALDGFAAIVFIGEKPPVAMFGYEDGLAVLVDESDASRPVMQLPSSSAGALLAACGAVGAMATARPVKVPTVPSNAGMALAPYIICSAIAKHQPADCVVVDESLTCGGMYYQQSQDCAPFIHMTLTGGSIGIGPPLSLGAAVALREQQASRGAQSARVVINFQADGSGLYSAQALWAQAREQLKVVTVVAANRAYAILEEEQRKQKLQPERTNTRLDGPHVDWCALAQGYGVPATLATTVGELEDGLRLALSKDGPHLIECVYKM